MLAYTHGIFVTLNLKCIHLSIKLMILLLNVHVGLERRLLYWCTALSNLETRLDS
jgi:hypothetical protein